MTRTRVRMMMMARMMALLLALLLISFPQLARSRFVVEKNSLTVISPESLKGNYDSAIGNFGIPQYGGTLSGTVVSPKDNPNACKDFSSTDLFRSRPGGLPIFVMVVRGGMRDKSRFSFSFL
jgi:hypothetical protein